MMIVIQLHDRGAVGNVYHRQNSPISGIGLQWEQQAAAAAVTGRGSRMNKQSVKVSIRPNQRAISFPIGR
jgi:hypothetical protein